MNCTPLVHYWLWSGSGSELDAPDHLPCQCGQYTRKSWATLESENVRLAGQVAALARQAIETCEAWDAVDTPDAAGEWSLYTMPELKAAARAALAAVGGAAQEGE